MMNPPPLTTGSPEGMLDGSATPGSGNCGRISEFTSPTKQPDR
jgi:hypothetical protein